MDRRRWITIAITLVSMPVGGFAIAFLLSRLFATGNSGWGDLIGLVTGLVIGPPLGNVVAFTICLLTLLRGRLRLPWAAWGINVGAVIVALVVIGIGMAVVARTESWVGTAIAVILGLGVAGVGAWFALRVGGSREQPDGVAVLPPLLPQAPPTPDGA